MGRPQVLSELLQEHKTTILASWFERIVETYQTDTAAFLKNQKNQFANPVGHAFTEGTEAIFQTLIENTDLKLAARPLEFVIKIRSVQDATPSEAVAFVFLLKSVIRQKLANRIRDNGLYDELLEFESRIDRLALMAFDMFMSSREKIFEARANAAKRQYSKLRERELYHPRPITSALPITIPCWAAWPFFTKSVWITPGAPMPRKEGISELSTRMK